MSFKISLIKDLPVWDSMPVAKIIHYPLEPRDYKPFAQARLCLGPDSLWVRMWAFEAVPSPTSALMARLNLYPDLEPDTYVSMAVQNGGEIDCQAVKNGGSSPMAGYGVLPQVKRFTSEDLQGIYWGVVFRLPRTLMPSLYTGELPELKGGSRLTGNLYKLDENPCGRHYGSFYPADFASGQGFSPSSFGEFQLVDY